ncbi:MAG: rod shape-determining protein MreC [Chloroflexi bacterium]|nr:rod shape-determining protein MreC [Chloroflexota bacterium]
MYPSRDRFTLLVILILIALAALALHEFGQLQPLENLAFTFMEPFLVGTTDAQGTARGAFGSFADVNALRAQIADLQAQVDAGKLDHIRVQELELENSTLRQQLSYAQANPDFDLVGATVLGRNPDLARIIGYDPSNLVRSIIVDQGSAEGVIAGMPVVTPQGLAGRIWTVGTHWSKVLLIVDASSSVNAVVQSTRATGVIQGGPSTNLTDNNLLMKYVPQGDAIKVGDTILTSGLGGNFPKRIVIGQVIDVHKRDNELFQEATIKPTVDFARLEFVLIMKRFTPSDITSEPTETPTAAPTPTKTPTAVK